MSHWTRSKVQIKDLGKLKNAAEKMGLSVQEADQDGTIDFQSSYAGKVKAKMIITDGTGQCAVVEGADGTYQTIIDNWSNPIVSKVGRDCDTLCRDYAAEVVRGQAMMMGGAVIGQTVTAKGELQLRVQLQ